MAKKVPEFTAEKWEKWVKDKEYAEDRVEHLEDELDKALDEQEKASTTADELRAERDAEKRLRVQAESDARRAKAAADQAAAAAAEASRSLKMGEKQGVTKGGKDGESQELRVEIQQLKAKNHGLNTQMDALATDHERLAGLLDTAEKDKESMRAEAAELRKVVVDLEREKVKAVAEHKAKVAESQALAASTEKLKAEAVRLEAQNLKLGDELDHLAQHASPEKSKEEAAAAAAALAAAVEAQKDAEVRAEAVEGQLGTLQVEIRTAREEIVALHDEAELKAGAAREGVAAADALASKATEEGNSLRAELTALREQQAASASEFKTELGATRERAAGLQRQLAAASGFEAELLAVREKAASLEEALTAALQQAEDEAEEHERKVTALEAQVEESEQQVQDADRKVTKAEVLLSEALAEKQAGKDRRDHETEEKLRDACEQVAVAKANQKGTASEARAEVLATELSESRQEGTKDQVMELIALLKDAETAKRNAEDELASKNEKIEKLEVQVVASSKTVLTPGHGSGTGLDRSGYVAADAEGGAARSLAEHGEKAAMVSDSTANGGGDGDVAEKIVTMQAELDDMHAMLDNVSAERDAALGGGAAAAASNGEDMPAKVEAMQAELDNLHAKLETVTAEKDVALREAQRAAVTRGDRESRGDMGDEEEVERLRRDCDKLRDQLSEYENGDVPPPGAKRIKSLEAQVERLSEENMRQADKTSNLARQVEREKEELSTELISAKLQVAQLYMQVDGLKLQHRQATEAASTQHAMELESASGSPVTSMSDTPSPDSRFPMPPCSPASPMPPGSAGSPRSPASPHTMEL